MSQAQTAAAFADIPYFSKPLFFFDQPRFREAMAKDSSPVVFKDAIEAANAQFDQRFREGEDIRNLVYERALFIDCMLHYACLRFDWGDRRGIALLAVGGYGRGELHPHSDIDLLVLLKSNKQQTHQENISLFITFLWDIGLEIGHSVRTVKECVKIAKDDITVATNILECRTLLGDDNLRQELMALTVPEKQWSADKFFKAKCDEQLQRHKKHNNTEYNLEPNIKNAPGGLRDIQTINWVAKRYFKVRTLRQLEGRGFFTDQEFAIFRTGEEFLWKVRYGLHMIAGRAEERLLFEYQKELAAIFGYHDTDKGLAVEQFMHWYYRIVLALRELNEVLLQFLDEAILNKGKSHSVVPINERFQLRDDFIEVTQTKVFEEDPSALLEIFVLMGQQPDIPGPRASTIRLIRENRHRIDDDFRRDPRNRELFMELLRIPYGLVTQLRSMKRYGVLGRYLPEFGAVTGQMQHDLFHIYTVDAHTLLVLKFMRVFRRPEAAESFPVAAHIMKRLPKQELLYIAGLYHDIGKGRGGDHSKLGAVDAENFCINHGLSRRETRLVCWLVEKHLLMSYVSQKQDISDPDVIHNFALEVGDQLHLDYLYTLTVADMNATNPDIWNAWRASLLRQLYLETKRTLRRGLENTVDKQDLIEETQAAALHKLQRKGFDPTQIKQLWGGMGEDYFVRESYRDIAWHTQAILQNQTDEPLILIGQALPSEIESATKIFIWMKERSNIFAAVCSCLSQLNLNIQDARLYHSDSGYTLDTFFVLDQNDEPIGDDILRAERIRKALQQELSLVDDYRNVIRRRTPRILKHFSMPTQTRLFNEPGSEVSVLEVISPDRPGLLARIGQVFVQLNIQLQNAKISTLGERVEDIFFITDADGKALSDASLCEDLQREIRQQLDEHVVVSQQQ